MQRAAAAVAEAPLVTTAPLVAAAPLVTAAAAAVTAAAAALPGAALSLQLKVLTVLPAYSQGGAELTDCALNTAGRLIALAATSAGLSLAHLSQPPATSFRHSPHPDLAAQTMQLPATQLHMSARRVPTHCTQIMQLPATRLHMSARRVPTHRTQIFLPPSSESCSSKMAAAASSGVSYSTMPHPCTAHVSTPLSVPGWRAEAARSAGAE